MRRTTIVALALICTPQNLEHRLMGLEILWLVQSSRRIHLVLETDTHCQRVSTPPQNFLRTRPDRHLCLGKSIAPSNNFISFEIGETLNGKNNSEKFLQVYLDQKSHILILPKVPSSMSQQFLAFLQQYQPKIIFLATFGKHKEDIFYWNLKSHWNPQWLLPNHSGRKTKKMENRWSHFLYRKDWPQRIKLRTRSYKGDTPSPNP